MKVISGIMTVLSAAGIAVLGYLMIEDGYFRDEHGNISSFDDAQGLFSWHFLLPLLILAGGSLALFATSLTKKTAASTAHKPADSFTENLAITILLAIMALLAIVGLGLAIYTEVQYGNYQQVQGSLSQHELIQRTMNRLFLPIFLILALSWLFVLFKEPKPRHTPVASSTTVTSKA